MAVISAAELKKNINEKAFKPVYLLFGEEDYLVELYLKRLSEAVDDGGMSDFNRFIAEDAKTPVSEISDFIDTYPMMSEKKLLIMRNTGILKSANEEVKSFWTHQLEDIPEYMVIVFAEKEADKRSMIYKAINKAGAVTEFAHLSPADTVTWAERQALAAKRKISKEKAEYLVEVCGEGLENLKNEIDKLLDYCDEEIMRSDIDRLVSKSLNVRVFEMTDAVMAHDADKALKILSDMKTVKESAYNILFTLFSTFDKMLYAGLLLREGENAEGIARKLKVPPFIARKYMKKSFSEDFLIDCVCAAAQIDLAVKNGETDDWTALEQFVAGLFQKMEK